jgi:uncharacterized membrane protein
MMPALTVILLIIAFVLFGLLRGRTQRKTHEAAETARRAVEARLNRGADKQNDTDEPA